MRHGKKFNHLGRKSGHRRALMRNLAMALIEHKRINTTLAKAKALRVYIEPLVTKAKLNNTHSRRVAFSYLQNKEAVAELFGPIAERVGDRPGGYVRIIKTGFRRGDGAETAMIEFVDFNEVYSLDKESSSGSGSGRRRRRRGRGKGSGAETPAAQTTETAVAEEQETAEESPAKETPAAEAEDATGEEKDGDEEADTASEDKKEG